MINVDANNSDQIYSDEKTTVLLFQSSWCQPCQVITEIITELEKEFPDVEFYNCDTDEMPDFCNRFSVMKIPTLIKFEAEKEIDRITGLKTLDTVKSFIE